MMGSVITGTTMRRLAPTIASAKPLGVHHCVLGGGGHHGRVVSLHWQQQQHHHHQQQRDKANLGVDLARCISSSSLRPSASSRPPTGHPEAELQRWREAVASVPLEKVIPLGLGGFADANTAAWFGDKALSFAVMKELRGTSESGGIQYLTNIHSAATNNENLAALIDEILPQRLLERIPPSSSMQIHDRGTMVEACVDAVAKEDPAAVDELARFLVLAGMASEGSSSSSSSSGDHPADSLLAVAEGNPKGKLLELGGELTCQVVGGLQHAPVFLAEARLQLPGGLLSAQAEGTSKKGAEKAAADQVLREAGLTMVVQPTQRVRLDEAASAEAYSLQTQAELADGGFEWTEVVFRSEDLVANLKAGEKLPAWFGCKVTIQRCIVAPSIFPELIRSVRV